MMQASTEAIQRGAHDAWQTAALRHEAYLADHMQFNFETKQKELPLLFCLVTVLGINRKYYKLQGERISRHLDLEDAIGAPITEEQILSRESER